MIHSIAKNKALTSFIIIIIIIIIIVIIIIIIIIIIIKENRTAALNWVRRYTF